MFDVDLREMGSSVRERCETTCRDFLHEELPDLALENMARYLASMIEGGLPEPLRGMRGAYRVLEEAAPFQCVSVFVDGSELSTLVLAVNPSRAGVEEALSLLKASRSRDRLFVYLFSFGTAMDEGGISEAVMEAELLQMVRDTGIVAYFAMLDPRAGMGMMARIDGDLRAIEYLPH